MEMPTPPRPELVGPGAFYVTGEDNIRLQSYNAASGVVLTMRGRFLTCDGMIMPFEFTHTPNTDRTLQSTLHRLGEGWLLNVYVVASSGTPIVGQTFVMVQLVRGLGGAVLELATLLQGVVTAVQRLAWPGSALTSTIGTPGALRAVSGTNPGAGAEISETVPTGARWRLLSFDVMLATDATAADRYPIIRIVPSGFGRSWEAGVSDPVTASTNARLAFADVAAAKISNGVVWNVPLPSRSILPSGTVITTTTTNLQAADDYGTPTLLVEEWIEGA